MTSRWPTVRLGEVLRHRKHFVEIDDTQGYLRCRVQLHARGIVLRDRVAGAEIRTKKQQVCRAGEFLVAEIDAKMGGYGVVPKDLDGAIVSSHYFLFEIDAERLDKGYLECRILTKAFREQVEARGSTNYAAIRPDQVLAYTIPLPPLPEQKRLASIMTQVGERIGSASALAEQTHRARGELARSLLFKAGAVALDLVPLAEILWLREPDILVNPEITYRFGGVYCFGRGVFAGATRRGDQFSYRRLTRLGQGDLVYPKLMAWEGAIGVVPRECTGLVVSPEFPVFEINRERVLPEVLDLYFRNPVVWSELAAASTGTNVRRRRLMPGSFMRLRVPLPDIQTQLRLQRVLAELRTMEAIHARRMSELGNLSAVSSRALFLDTKPTIGAPS